MSDAGDELYGLPLEEFTAARNALAKELTKQKDRDAAAAVKRLPKPTKPAWALNQVARRQPQEVERLLEAGQRARQAQERALAGDASDLRAATRAEAECVNQLVDAALAVLGESGGAATDRLRRTLQASATNTATAALLRQGRLVADVEVAGFGLEGVDEVPDFRPPPPTSRPLEPAPPKKRDDKARRETLREAHRDAERLLRQADSDEHRAQRLAEDAERAERRAKEARDEADEAAAVAAESRRAADEAEARLEALAGDDSGE